MTKRHSVRDHELAIATSIDRVAARGAIGPAEICEVIQSLDFTVERKDCEFLAFYVYWRRSNPIA